MSSLGQRSFNSTSEEDEEDETRDNKEKGRRREFPTESSDDEDSLKLLGGKDRLIIVEGKERNSEPNEIGKSISLYVYCILVTSKICKKSNFDWNQLKLSTQHKNMYMYKKKL